MLDAATGEGLLRAILEEPGDDALRLIYADWLEDHGDAARGEFIRVQCELAKIGGLHPPADDEDRAIIRRAKALRRCERELLERWVEYWIPAALGQTTGVATAPDGCQRVYFGPDSWCVFRRGSVAEVRLPLASWRGEPCPTCRGRCSVRMPISTRCGTCRGSGVVNRCGPSIVRAAPVERVVLSDREPLASPSGRQWFWYQHTGGASGGSSLPPALFDLLPGEPLPSTYFLCKSYPTRQAAEGALSPALIAWAKEQP